VTINDFKDLYIIGETAYNHEGDIDYLYNMIDEISELEINSVKFHLLLNIESYLQVKHPLTNEIKKWVFNENQWDDIIDYSVTKNLDVIALCDDVESLEYINRNNKDVFAVEIHATGLNDLFLLNESAKFKGKVILGVGGSTIDEITYAVDFLKSNGKDDIILMYGFQNYPTDYRETNLSKMLKLKNLFNLPVGYADHTAFDDPNNEIISIMAAAMGFNILEKHYTLDEGEKRIDHHAAVGEDKMARIKELMETALTIYGNNSLKMSASELEYGNIGPMKKAIVAKNDIKIGEKLSFDNVCFKRTVEESTIKQDMFLQLIGLESIKDIAKDELIDFSKVKYEFKRTDSESFTHI
jgi:sialic acid synthase SpsE